MENIKPSRTAAILNQKCPRCYKGEIFKHPTLSLKFQQMHENCPVCNQKYEIEPGFFWGSMYISYGITVIIGILTTVGAYHLLNDPPVWQYLVILTLMLIIVSPVSFRYSRVFMLYWFASIDHDPKAGNKQ